MFKYNTNLELRIEKILLVIKTFQKIATTIKIWHKGQLLSEEKCMIVGCLKVSTDLLSTILAHEFTHSCLTVCLSKHKGASHKIISVNCLW